MEMESDQIVNSIQVATPLITSPIVSQTPSASSISNQPTVAAAVPTTTANVVTIPVPIVNNEGTYAYVTVKGSLHDRSCSVFGLNETEIQALSKRFENSVKPVVNGVMVSCSPLVMLNTLAQLSYKVVCSSGEAEICWTMQREI